MPTYRRRRFSEDSHSHSHRLHRRQAPINSSHQPWFFSAEPLAFFALFIDMLARLFIQSTPFYNATMDDANFEWAHWLESDWEHEQSLEDPIESYRRAVLRMQSEAILPKTSKPRFIAEDYIRQYKQPELIPIIEKYSQGTQTDSIISPSDRSESADNVHNAANIHVISGNMLAHLSGYGRNADRLVKNSVPLVALERSSLSPELIDLLKKHYGYQSERSELSAEGQELLLFDAENNNEASYRKLFQSLRSKGIKALILPLNATEDLSFTTAKATADSLAAVAAEYPEIQVFVQAKQASQLAALRFVQTVWEDQDTLEDLISMEPIQNPVVDPDGGILDQSSVEQLFAGNDTAFSPRTRQLWQKQDCRPLNNPHYMAQAAVYASNNPNVEPLSSHSNRFFAATVPQAAPSLEEEAKVQPK